MTKRSLVLVSALLLGALMWASLQQDKGLYNGPSQTKTPKSFLKNVATDPVATQYQASAPKENLPPEILREAALSGTTDENPALIELRLNEMAARLTQQEMDSLVKVIETPSSDGDLRATAVEILSRNKTEAAIRSLNDVAKSKWEKLQDPRLQSFEEALRGRAIEGLESHPHEQATQRLAQLTRELQDDFLRDRAQRAFLHRKGEVPAAEDQDREALKKILEK